MRATNRGLALLIAILLLWVAGGHAFYRIDQAHDARDYGPILELIVHKRALAEATPGARVIIAGGSNAYYGIDSNRLAEHLGVPVVNMALPFGAYNNAINLRLLEDQVRPGDVVVYSAAGYWGAGPGVGGAGRRAQGFDSFVDAQGLAGYDRLFDGGDIPWQSRPETNTLLLATVESFLPPKLGVSWLEDTNAHGDFTGCVPLPVLMPVRFDSKQPDADLAATVRDSAEKLAEKGAHLVVALPWLLIREHDRADWSAFTNRLITRYEPAVPVITPDPHALLNSNPDDFCDSPLHLSTEATRRRTDHLADRVGPYLEASAPRRSAQVPLRP